MGYFIQQVKDSLVIHKEVGEVFPITKVKITCLKNGLSSERNVFQDTHLFMDKLCQKPSIYELSIYLYDQWLPIDRTLFDPDNIKKDDIPFPLNITYNDVKETIQKEIIKDVTKTVKRKIKDFDKKYTNAQEEFETKLKETINEITNL